MNIYTYFTRPFKSQDKGTVENKIGVIRRFFPKKITEKQVEDVEQKTPLRKFNYKTPNIVQIQKNALIT